MSRDSIATLSFGIAFDENFNFPWSDRERFDGITGWWLELNGFVEPDSNIYEAEQEWLELYPLPVELINYCSNDYSMSILTTRHYCVCWGETLKIDLQQLAATVEEDTKVITDFLNKYQIKYEGNPNWILSSFYG